MAAPRLVMIDNYDSFTYNLVQYLGELGAGVDVRRNDAVTLDEIAALRPDAVVIAGGEAFVQAGAGIVADSVPEREYQETLAKAGVLFDAIKQAEAMP